MARANRSNTVKTSVSAPRTTRTYNWAAKRFEALPEDKCQHHRQRWPQVEAVIQVIFRAVVICIHFCPLYIILLAHQTYWAWPLITFFAISWSMFICIIEVVSLTAPGGFCGLRRFPRLPSIYLAMAEFLAIFFTLYNIYEVLRPNWRQKDGWGRIVENLDCPVATCVSKDEYYGIAVFQSQLLSLVFHMGFFVMAMKHVLSRALKRYMPMD